MKRGVSGAIWYSSLASAHKAGYAGDAASPNERDGSLAPAKRQGAAPTAAACRKPAGRNALCSPPAACSSLFAAGSLDRLLFHLLGFPLFMGAPRLGLQAPPANRRANASHKTAGRNALRSPPAACSSLFAAGSLNRLLFSFTWFSSVHGYAAPWVACSAR